ncbi:MAG: M48 family metallopeptidase [Janthinobacterium sp.]|jgi:predicted Zn-dependent protease
MAPISLKRYTVLASLCAATALAPLPAFSQQQVEQDGIKVRPLSGTRVFAGGENFNEKSRLQYAELVRDAKEKNALVPDSDPQVKRLRAIAQRIIPYAARWNDAASSWQWQINLLNSDEVNAFCMPGGQIAFYSGIITKLNLTDDEVAVVMGHEISHALREHAQAQAGKGNLAAVGAKLAGAGLSAWLGVDPNLTSTATNMAAKGVMLKFSRDDEREADLIGMDLAARAGFDPRAGVALWQKMAAVSKGAPPEFLSTHPSGSDRISQMNEHMAQVLPLYARSKGVSVNALPPYRSTAIAQR